LSAISKKVAQKSQKLPFVKKVAQQFPKKKQQKSCCSSFIWSDAKNCKLFNKSKTSKHFTDLMQFCGITSNIVLNQNQIFRQVTTVFVDTRPWKTKHLRKRDIDMSDRNPPVTATSVTFWPSLRHASGL